MKVYIDPACDIHYASFYIYGLKKRFGNKVFFKDKPFQLFNHNNNFFAFIIKDKNFTRKVVIDFGDLATIDQNALDWCDVYGKINLEATVKHPKIMPIGPSFGINLYTLP